MIHGHDFKYTIPEMDTLLGLAADMGIHFSHDQEEISFPDGKKYLIQIVNGKINDTFLQLMATTHDIHEREEEAI